METRTIGQLSAASGITSADYIEIEQSGISKHADFAQVVEGLVATSAQSLLGSSDAVLMTPNQVRVAMNANNSPPVYACRGWVNFDQSTTSSSIAGTYTRSSGTTLVVCVATGHGCITGNYAYINFTTGGASVNTYLITYIGVDSFSVDTVSTSSILTSNFTLPRNPIRSGGNVNNISYIATGVSIINFSSLMPSSSYACIGSAVGDSLANACAFISSPYLIREPGACDINCTQPGGTAANRASVSDISVAVFT